MVEAVGGGETFSTRTAARILAVTPERIRYWVKRNLIRPLNSGGRKYRFAFNDLLEMRLAKELLGTRQHIEPVQRCLDRVREFVAPDRSVTSLKLVNDDGRIVASGVTKWMAYVALTFSGDERRAAHHYRQGRN